MMALLSGSEKGTHHVCDLYAIALTRSNGRNSGVGEMVCIGGAVLKSVLLISHSWHTDSQHTRLLAEPVFFPADKTIAAILKTQRKVRTLGVGQCVSSDGDLVHS
ncbi:hypothetical protein NDU88_003696 [Pleurodeles waltl]|uniref:Uncharacterized protein n=1 Tax=Pleurodeles waltl TaxID=8319 RepID=A0AAV7M5U3_PLEWA|nr:hypothetical protein NDU88_003696 [Pleurodeles waltl]